MQIGKIRCAIGRQALVLTLVAFSAPLFGAERVKSKYFPGCPQWDHQVKFVNSCEESIIVTETAGCFKDTNPNPPFDGGNCWPNQAGTFSLFKGQSKTVSIPSCWTGNFGVACVGCDVLITSLAEFTFDGGLGPKYKKLNGLLDTYDVSMVNGFVRPIEIKPSSTVPQGGGSCLVGGCSATPLCPPELGNGGGSCLSPCKYAVATDQSNTDQLKYCCVCSMSKSAPCSEGQSHPNRVAADCVGKYGCSPFSPPGSENPGSACCPWYDEPRAPCSAKSADRAWESWAQQYIAEIHAACPNQYAWQFDDQNALVTCQGKDVPMDYVVTFCP